MIRIVWVDVGIHFAKEAKNNIMAIDSSRPVGLELLSLLRVPDIT